MTYDDLSTLLDYHYWARDRVLEAVEPLSQEQFTRDLGNSFGSVRDTLAHILAAEWIWLSRWLGAAPTALLPASRISNVAEARAEWSERENEVRAFLRSMGPDGVNRVFDYKLMSGQPGSSPFWQMLQHVVNHATYHRGQITTMLRQLGAQPPKAMDMIMFYRELK
jgi:uncharacterized damage-inducible protein DinB